MAAGGRAAMPKMGSVPKQARKMPDAGAEYGRAMKPIRGGVAAS